MARMRENEYQQYLVNEIYKMFRHMGYRMIIDVIVYINDPNQIQGIPDLTIMFRPTGRFAFLEVKTSEKSPRQPNQEWYLHHWGESIYTSFIYPENEKEVLLAVRETLAS